MRRPPDQRRGLGRARQGIALLFGVGLAAAAGGCELIVPGDLASVHCTEDGAVGPPVCPYGMFCHDGLCTQGPPALGAPCVEDDLCAPGDRCVEPESLGLGGASFCSRPCCSSADCGAGTDLVCAALGPGKMCVAAERWGRKAPGDRLAGEACGKGSECRSGLCEGGTCADTCCGDAECAANGGACAVGATGWSCAPDPAGEGAFPHLCEGDAECESGLCVKWADGIARCADPCCSSRECGAVKLADGLRPALCVPVRHGSALVLACAAASEGDAIRDLGEPCEKDAQCRGGRCIEAGDAAAPGEGAAAKVCSDACCTDASCGAPELFTCAPRDGGVKAGSPTGSGGQGFDLQCVRR